MERIRLKDRKISIIGMARSGRALARVLSNHGAKILVSDVKSHEALKDIKEELSDLSIEWEAGGHTERVYKERDVIIISPGVSINTPILQEAMKAGVPVISEVEMAYDLCEAPFIAVTGTNGKSTTTTLIHEMLKADGRKSFLAGNIGTPLVGEVEAISADAWVAAEISSFQLETVVNFRPKVALLLNVTNDHIDRHGSFENYRDTKGRLFSQQQESDFAVFNADDEAVMHASKGVKSRRLFFSRRKTVEEGAYCIDDRVMVKWEGVEREFFKKEQIPLKGNHNLENVLALSCVALALGIKADVLLQALNNFKPLHYRMAYVDTINGIKFYNDSKGTNPDAVRAALASFREPVVIIAGGTDKGLDFMPLARNIGSLAHAAVLIGESRHKIATALEKTGFDRITLIDDMTLPGFKKSIKKAMDLCPDGGVVLLSPSCASFDMFNRAEHRGEMFDTYVRELKREHEGTEKYQTV